MFLNLKSCLLPPPAPPPWVSHRYSGLLNILASFAGYILCLHHYGLTLTDVFMTAKYFVLGADDFVVGHRVYRELVILGSLQSA
jgi:hypothetical protein